MNIELKHEVRPANAERAQQIKDELSSVAYPKTPGPMLEATERGDGLPESPGIYFIWNSGSVVYVGQSSSLKARCSFMSHHVLEKGDLISFVELPEALLLWAEAYYIGVNRPIKNFGTRGHYFSRRRRPDVVQESAGEPTEQAQPSRIRSAQEFRQNYTVEQFAAEILCGNLSAEWVRDQIAARKIKALTKRPILISQGEAMRFLGI